MKKMQSTLLKMNRALLLAAVFVLVTIIGASYGAESINVPSITPLFEQSDESLKKPGIARTRNGFIERIGEDGNIVVISDATKRLAPDARFYQKAHGTPISLSQIEVGTYVGYTVNDAAEIVMMWIAE